MATAFRAFPVRLWNDVRVRAMAKDNMSDAISVYVHGWIGIPANEHEAFSGIYHMPVETYEIAGITTKRAIEMLDYINKKFPTLQQYDFNNKILYNKLFLEEQLIYRRTTAALPDLIEGYEKTFDKAPWGWYELSNEKSNYLHKLRDHLVKELEALSKDPKNVKLEEKTEQKKFIVALLDLKNKKPKDLPNTNPIFCSAKKLKK